MARSFILLLLAVAVFALSACSEGVIEDSVSPPADDLIPYEPEQGKSDGFGFDPNLLIDDAVFEDAQFLTQPQLQAFFEATPYRGGQRSFLADFIDDGLSVSTILMESAQRWQINPLVLLTKLQVESSAVYKQTVPTRFQLERAIGCGCPDDDPSCTAAPKGLALQIDCAARLFRSYLNELSMRNVTRSGWRIGRSKQTLDPESVTPRNAATAALYTYTPWVLQGEGGNWLFWNVYHRFAKALLADTPNHRFIGGPCLNDADCRFDDGFCLLTAEETDPFNRESERSKGVCTKRCERTCPDRSQPHTAITFCATVGEEGLCMPRCNQVLFDGNEGCGAHLTCVTAERFSEPDRTQSVCIPPVENSSN